MKKLIILSALIAAVFTSCNSGSVSLKTEQDSLAYAIGLDLGNYIKNLDSTINVNVVSAAIKDVIANKPKIESEAAMAFLRDYFMVKKPAKEKEASVKFLEQVQKDNKNIQKTESGLLYEIITPGTDKPQSAEDVVRVMYKGTLKDGKVFDSSYDRGDTAEFALNRVIKGWSEGLQLVGKGGKIKLWIPAELGYGEQGAGQMIGPNQALVFEVELVDVTPAAAAAAAAAAAPAPTK